MCYDANGVRYNPNFTYEENQNNFGYVSHAWIDMPNDGFGVVDAVVVTVVVLVVAVVDTVYPLPVVAVVSIEPVNVLSPVTSIDPAVFIDLPLTAAKSAI